MNFFDINIIVSLFFLCLLLYLEFRRDLMMLQQNSYRPERYRRWMRDTGDTTTYSRLIGLFLFFLALSRFGISWFATACMSLFAICQTINLAKRKYKKPPVMTRRAIRLMLVSCGITGIVTAAVAVAAAYGAFGYIPSYGMLGGCTWLYAIAVTLLLIYCLSYAFMLAAVYCLKPVEAHINRKFYNDAAKRLAAMPDLKIVGITGSYGKTSTKHYLHRILSEHFETLMTPGSFNTTLGVVRTVREHLKPYHQVFIVEMGAKQTGDIREICDLVHPQIGIITAVGPQHLETFKTIENVRDTKFELADSLPTDGLAVLNNDYAIIADRPVHNCRTIRYTCNKATGTDYSADNIEYGPQGTKFTLHCPDGTEYRFETVLLGEYNIANLTGAIAVAIEMGVPVEKIRYSVSRIEPVEHRLSMRRHPNGLTILDDAFNSNPAGAAMAVDVLSRMTGGRRIIITPGMIELGDRQEELNREFGRQIANSGIEYVAVVGQYNHDAIVEGLSEGGFDREAVLSFDTFLDANAWLISFARQGDIALIENDLPDTFK